MGTAFIAVDKCDKENGCLQVAEKFLLFSVHSLIGIERVTLSW